MPAEQNGKNTQTLWNLVNVQKVFLDDYLFAGVTAITSTVK